MSDPSDDSWPLAFAPGAMGREKFLLLEVEPDLLGEILAGNDVAIQGPGDASNAVLCTSDKTYGVRVGPRAAPPRAPARPKSPARKIQTSCRSSPCRGPEGPLGGQARKHIATIRRWSPRRRRFASSPAPRLPSPRPVATGRRDGFPSPVPPGKRPSRRPPTPAPPGNPPPQVKKVETSNMMLLAPPGGRGPGILVDATASSHLEVSRAAPDLQPLRDALRGCPYPGPSAGPDRNPFCLRREAGGDSEMPEPSPAAAAGGAGGAGPPGLAWRDMHDVVGASDAELRQVLGDGEAVEVGGAWRYLEPGHRAELVRMLAITCVAEGWDAGRVPGAGASEVLGRDGYDPGVAFQVLRAVSDPADGEAEASAAAGAADTAPRGAWRVDAGRCYRAVARAMLERVAEWPLGDLLARLAAAVEVPGAAPPGPGALRGEALAVATGAGARAVRLCEGDLPLEAGARFKALFAARERWTLAELGPYLGAVVGPGEAADAVLIRHARATQSAEPGGAETFSARYDW